MEAEPKEIVQVGDSDVVTSFRSSILADFIPETLIEIFEGTAPSILNTDVPRDQLPYFWTV